jgi:mannose-6-phosphate isomerase-like protein (cupin superfamily)
MQYPIQVGEVEPMGQIVDRSNAEHYVWGEGCDGWHLLGSDDLSVIHERVPAGAGEVRHYHSNARQFFFALVGSITMELDGGPVTFHAGQGVHVPPGTRHRLVNRSGSPVEFLVVSSPSTSGDRINEPMPGPPTG